MFLKIKLCNDNAVFPKKAHPTDVGYDLTCISIDKKISENIIRYDTGISVSPSEGYYVEIVPRSSLSSTGYILANSVGIVDPEYTGTLKVVLIRVDKTLPELTLPFTKCQLVVRRLEECILHSVDDLKLTERGSGGFGSTDK